jgi:hypothetical protein
MSIFPPLKLNTLRGWPLGILWAAVFWALRRRAAGETVQLFVIVSLLIYFIFGLTNWRARRRAHEPSPYDFMNAASSSGSTASAGEVLSGDQRGAPQLSDLELRAVLGAAVCGRYGVPQEASAARRRIECLVHGFGAAWTRRFTAMLRTDPQMGRNAPCPCGSSDAFTACCFVLREFVVGRAPCTDPAPRPVLSSHS